MTGTASSLKTDHQTVLKARNLGRRYGATTALADLDLDLRTGEVVGLIGQNGAGKSTLLKLLTGVEQPDTGSIEVHGRPTRLRSVADAGRKGVGIVFQEQSLVPNLTVAENLVLGRPTPAVKFGIQRRRLLLQEASGYLEAAGSSIDPAALVGDLSFVDRQSVELAKVLALESRTDGPLAILFDEPTSVLSASEIDRLFREIRRLRSRAAIVFVSHRMDEVLAVSDRVVVMRDGRAVAERARSDVDADELYRLMVGSQRAEDYYLRDLDQTAVRDQVVLIADHASSHGHFLDINFQLHAGQILGIAGVVGSGREALCRSVFGLIPLTGGSYHLPPARTTPTSPGAAVRSGVGFVPAERRVEGMVPGRSIHENLVLAATPRLAWRGLVRRPRVERALVQEWTSRLKVKMPSVRAEIQRLSGGNQQKVVLAKWLALDGLRVLVLDHPTRGLDAGAKRDVYAAIRGATEMGIGVLLLSDTLEELTGLADQIMVMRDGKQTGFFPDVAAVTPDELIRLMV